MPNRYRDFQSGDHQQGRRAGAGRNDESRYSSTGEERDYGSYTENDEGDSSVRAGSYDQGRTQQGQQGQPGRYGSRDRQGSQDYHERGGGRYSGYGDFGQGDYGGGRQGWSSGQERSGQDRSGQSGFGQRERGFGEEFRGGNYGGGTYGGANRSGGSYGGGVGAAGNDLNYGSGTGRGFSGYGYEGQGSIGQHGSGWSSGGRESQGEGQPYGQRGQYGGESGYGGQSGFGQSGYGQSNHGQSNYWQSNYGQSGYGGQSGLHRGKGPKGYQRTDERLKELICERLRDDPEIDPSEVTINVQGGKVTLEGTVDSRHAKNAIEDVAEQFGVQEVQNNLRVQRASSGADTSKSTLGRAGTEDNDRNPRQNKH